MEKKVEYHKDGKTIEREYFVDDKNQKQDNHKEDGTQEIESYYPNGQLEYKEVRDVNGISNGLSQHYNKEG